MSANEIVGKLLVFQFHSKSLDVGSGIKIKMSKRRSREFGESESAYCTFNYKNRWVLRSLYLSFALQAMGSEGGTQAKKSQCLKRRDWSPSSQNWAGRYACKPMMIIIEHLYLLFTLHHAMSRVLVHYKLC